MKRLATRSFRKWPTERLVREALRRWESDCRWPVIMELHFRADDAMLATVRALARSPNWRRRSLGLFIAAQLQHGHRVAGAGIDSEFAPLETRALLFAGLLDPHPEVAAAAASGLAHRPHPESAAHLVSLVKHRHAKVRSSVARALGRVEGDAAANALVLLAHDESAEVRNWATFALASQPQADTPGVREVLWLNLHDNDADVRGEALLGLAVRRDERAIAHLIKHLDEDCRVYELEAAEALASPLLLEPLERLKHGLSREGGDAYWWGKWDHAVVACRNGT